jgi:hypothetical protein
MRIYIFLELDENSLQLSNIKECVDKRFEIIKLINILFILVFNLQAFS